MRRVSFLVFGAVVFSAAWLAPTCRAEDGLNSVQPAQRGLTPESLTSVLDLARPSDSEWRHLRVEWMTDVVAARKKAANEDKPIVICYTGGAGYNEPLGVC